MLKTFLSFFLIVLVSGKLLAAAEQGESVVVIYNALMPESKAVADHYAAVRHVPEKQLLGLDLPKSETMTREQFRSDLQKPLLKWLEEENLFKYRSDAGTNKSTPHWRVHEASVRYAVLCFGVPSRILEDADIHEDAEKVPAGARRNGASVDSELTLLAMEDYKLPLVGPVRNPFFDIPNPTNLNPVSGIVLVARLDGPTVDVAGKLVDRAIEAENTGLWGRAYFDIRGVTNEFKPGDDMMRSAADTTRKFGFETIMDEKPETFSKTFPLNQVALYAGWYDENVSGPFSLPTVEFMPGAIAYHLHSFSAATLRSTNTHWVGPLLSKGVTATMGCVDEPFVAGTPDMGVFFDRLLHGASFGEAAWAAAPVLSWQTTVIGDPLYRPFGKHPREQHERLLAQQSKLIEWSHLRVANLNLSQGFPLAETISYLEAEAKESPVLSEKLGDLYLSDGKRDLALQSYKRALSLHPSPQQENRLKSILAEKFSGASEKADEKKTAGSSK